MSEQDCIFCKITNGQIESEMLYRNDNIFVIRDINPKAPVHLLIIPSQHITSLVSSGAHQTSNFGQMLVVAEKMARKERVEVSGYRLILNQGRDSGQDLVHIHLHLLGGHRLTSM